MSRMSARVQLQPLLPTLNSSRRGDLVSSLGLSLLICSNGDNNPGANSERWGRMAENKMTVGPTSSHSP